MSELTEQWEQRRREQRLEAARKGGAATLAKYGRAHFSRISKGGMTRDEKLERDWQYIEARPTLARLFKRTKGRMAPPEPRRERLVRESNEGGGSNERERR